MDEKMIKDISDKAVIYKHSGYNCAQAVVKALSEAKGIDNDMLLQATSGFAVGMGTMEATCGALIGANMIAGIEMAGNGTIMKSKELFSEFTKNSGGSICKDLKGIDTGVVKCECDDCIRNAICAYGEKIG